VIDCVQQQIRRPKHENNHPLRHMEVNVKNPLDLLEVSGKTHFYTGRSPLSA
jgi:hypothetical protein